MGLYLGNGDKFKITTINGACTLHIGTPITSGVRLLSFDNYILKDSNGLFLTPKEDN